MENIHSYHSAVLELINSIQAEVKVLQNLDEIINSIARSQQI
jgi:hypothetical protein